MAMKVTMYLRGSIICYLKNQKWILELPTDATHRGRFIHTGTAQQVPELRKPGISRTIAFSISPGDVEGPEKGIGFTRILNMNDSKMHGRRLIESRRNTMGREVVRIEIPTGKLSHSASTSKRYAIERIKPTQERPIALGRTVSAELKLTFELERGQKLTIGFQNSDHSVSDPIEFEYREGNLILAIDNDCGSACKTSNDFELYYECVADCDRKTEFSAGKTNRGRASPEGNCDPVSSDPPPGP